MKLFIDCRMLGSGGIGTYLDSILPYLVKDNKCTLLCFSSQIQRLSAYKNITKIIQTEIKTFSLKELFLFPKQLKKEINSCDAFYTPYCNVPSGIKIPVFTTIHDIVFLDVAGLTSKTGTLVRKFFYQHAINRSRLIFTVSDFSAQRIKAKLRIKNKPLIVTYNAIPRWFSQNVSDTYNIEKDNSIIFVGNIKKHKGLSTLLDAFEYCINDGMDAKLTIIGNAENFRSGDQETVEKLERANNKNIIFTGKISDSELKEYYQKARLLVQPSFYEGFGMPPMEALICGTNVIISDIPVFKEIYKDFPVTFFEAGNSLDLAEKIKLMFNASTPTPASIPQKYSFEKTASIILDNLQNITRNN